MNIGTVAQPGVPPHVPGLDEANLTDVPGASNRADGPSGTEGVAKPDADVPGVMQALFRSIIANTASGPERPTAMANAPELAPPHNDTRASLTLLLGRLQELMSESSLTELQNRLAQWDAQAAAQQAALDQSNEAFNHAVADARQALDALADATTGLANALAARDQAEKTLAQTRAALDAAPPDTPEYDAARTAYDAAKSAFDLATRQFDDAGVVAGKAYDAARSAMKQSDDLLVQLLGNPNAAPNPDADQHLDEMGKLLLLMARYAKLLGDNAEKAVQEDMKFFEAVRKVREADIQRKSDEYQEKTKKASFLGNLFGVLGKVLGAVLAVVGVLGAVFTGGMSMTMTVVGAALLTDTIVGAATGFSLVGEALKPIMTHVIQPLATVIGNGISGMLEKFGVAKETAETIGAVVGAIVAAVVVVALIAVTAVMGGGAAASKFGKALSSLVGDLIKKIVPDLLREAGKAGGKMIANNLASLGARLGVKEGNAQMLGNTLNGAVTTAELGLAGTQAGGSAATGVFEKQATDLRADMTVSQEVLDQIKGWVKQAAERFAGTESVVTSLMSQMSDAAKDRYSTQRFVANNVRA